MALKFDDQFPIHRKVGGLSDAAFRFHVESIFWCSRNLTDGVVADREIGDVSRYRRPGRYVAECEERNLWHRFEGGKILAECEECRDLHPDLPGDGWVVHGYFDWQQSRIKVLQTREARRLAGHNGGVASGKARRKGKPAGHDPPEPKVKQVGSLRFEANANPEPPRPPTGGSGRGRARASQRTLKPSPRCPRHDTQPANNCAFCRSETIAREPP